MTTDVRTLREYAEMLLDLADDWEGDQPYVLIGDVHGDVSVTAKDGFTKLGPVGFAKETFDTNGVMELGDADWRLYGTVMVDESAFSEDMREQIESYREQND